MRHLIGLESYRAKADKCIQYPDSSMASQCWCSTVVEFGERRIKHSNVEKLTKGRLVQGRGSKGSSADAIGEVCCHAAFGIQSATFRQRGSLLACRTSTACGASLPSESRGGWTWCAPRAPPSTCTPPGQSCGCGWWAGRGTASTTPPCSTSSCRPRTRCGTRPGRGARPPPCSLQHARRLPAQPGAAAAVTAVTPQMHGAVH